MTKDNMSIGEASVSKYVEGTKKQGKKKKKNVDLNDRNCILSRVFSPQLAGESLKGCL